MRRAHVFDMDGTLLHGTSASLLLAEALGELDALHDLEARFAGGHATAVDFARAVHQLWGVIPADVVAQAFAAAPLLANVREVLADIHARDERACLITLSPDYFAERFLEFGFDAVYASGFPRDADTPLDESRILDVASKPVLARAFCEQHGLQLDQAIAYGDSMSDVLLFEQVAIRIAVNADHHLADRSDVAVSGLDLLPAYEAARRLAG
jgi:phosphoserine phosphatase